MRTTWFSSRALRLHVTLVVVVGACFLLGWWQLSRAVGGNSLSWVYTFEWPFFALYGVYMWWKLIHEPLSETRAAELEASKAREAEVGEQSVRDRVEALAFDPYDDSDPELAAYNRYLANLHEKDAAARRGPASSPGRAARAARAAARRTAADS